MDPVTILDKAIDILETEGWRTGAPHKTGGGSITEEDRQQNEGPHCMMGALEKAAGLEPWAVVLSMAPVGAPEVVGVVFEAVSAETKRRMGGRAWTFNDTRPKDTGMDQVIDVLRHTKKAFENGEVQ